MLSKGKRSNHVLPICDGVKCLLGDRRDIVFNNELKAHCRRWGSPERSPRSKTGHYLDSKSLREYLFMKAGIVKLGTHNLRRTFGRIA
ncbi:Putative integrase, fragment [Erwinia tasmaniensis Et1/99]|uniref:Integrase n=1 Tax=Erwinia tasmaniensis (strain DSM 17950 / CFBP 7177 / CIP 109463 / NCPPB 4357 / Et1/99) TaxID=465817 RepID=B2VC05_ERWT9|nr:Putative integrase, fragment [Erwinia tasmaniensis Et1/99]